jgi:hypothetical protein
MNTKTTLIKILCAVVLLTGILNFAAHAEDAVTAPVVAGEQGDYVARLKAALKNANTELGAVQAQAAEQNRRIAQLEEQLKNAGTAPAVAAAQPGVDATQLQQELKSSKLRINELEEQLFVATDGKGVKGQEVEEILPEGTYPWTENMRRMPIGVLFPKTATIPKGEVYARFSHTSQNQTFAQGGKGDPFDDLLGMESGVKVGILFGYGITKNWDVMIHRSNGRDYTPDHLDPGDTDRHSYDLWDIMTKYKFLDENKQFIDLSTSVGGTYFWQDEGAGRWAGNAALLAEKSFWRFRAGSGLLYTSLSEFQGAVSTQSDTEHDKPYPNEDADGVSRPENHTMAIPVSLSFALTKRQQLFSEMAFPVSGYDTGNGPSMAAGWRYNTHSHAYSIYLSNTANLSYNSAFTGGYKENRLDLFGFDISIFF